MNADALLHWLQRTSLEASLLILAVLGLRVLLGPRLNPAWRLGLWTLVGLKLLLPACIPAGFGLGLLGREPMDGAAQMPRMDPMDEMDLMDSGGEVPKVQDSFSLRQAVPAVWLLGSLSVIGIALLRQRRFQCQFAAWPLADDPKLMPLLHQLAAQVGVATPRIRLTALGHTPALVGLHQPTLLLPGDWASRFTDRSLRHVLLHELLHIRHRDLLWNWVATILQALHWFNPLVWFVVDRFQADRELRCDAGALAMLAPSERLDYGRTLLRIQESFFAPPSLAGLAPCVRHHPTLRQRLLMITTPTTRQPALQALLVLTLTMLAGYAFTTAHAAEKEVPPKIREGAATRPSDRSDKSNRKPAMKEGEGGKPGTERDGQRQPSAEREGGGKTGPRDGDRPRTGPRDGDRPKTGLRDGDRPKTGERDGGKPRTGAADGEGRRPSAEAGQKPRPSAEANAAGRHSAESFTLKVIEGGDAVVIGGEKVPLNRLRGFLSQFLPKHPGARIEVTGEDDTPLKALHNVVDAVRDNGNRNVGIKAE